MKKIRDDTCHKSITSNEGHHNAAVLAVVTQPRDSVTIAACRVMLTRLQCSTPECVHLLSVMHGYVCVRRQELHCCHPHVLVVFVIIDDSDDVNVLTMMYV